MWKLDYDDALLLYIPAETTIDLQNSSFYKLSLRRYVYEIRTGFLQFKSTLTYLDFKRIIQLCEQESKKKGFSLVVSPSLRGYIENRELHIDARSRLGIELKDHCSKLQVRFDFYREIVDNAMARKLAFAMMQFILSTVII